MTRAARLFYLGMISTDAYGRAVGEKTYSGAAARKMILVARALRSVGHHAVVVSLPFVGAAAGRLGYGRVLTSDSGVPTVFLTTMRSKYLRKLFGPLVLGGFVWCRIERHDTVIVYNHAVEYIPALVLLRLKGVKIVQDIEDAPTNDERGLGGLVHRLSFALTSRLTSNRKMVVADNVARSLALDDYVVVRGVASQEAEANYGPNLRKWDMLREGKALKIHFGGTLIAETGVDLFCTAVERLAQCDAKLDRPVDFTVTGIGEIHKIRNLRDQLQTCKRVKVSLHPEIGKADYLALIDGCHASLSLKRPGSEMENTTFPSKVIEITASGLALVSTRIGDVPEIFDARSAFFLDSYKAAEIVDIIFQMTSDTELVEQVARAGQEVCRRIFSPAAVSKEMSRLLEHT